MNKKGEMSDMFKYILVAVAGIAFLIFLVIFAAGIADLGAQVGSVETRETLNDYFTALSTVEFISTPGNLKIDTTMLFHTPVCGQLSVQQNEGGGDPASYEHIIYAPGKLEGKTMEVWSYSWFYPYRVVNFFYLTNRQTKIVLAGDDQLIDELMKEIPPNMNIVKGSATNLGAYAGDAQGFELFKLVVIGNAQPSVQGNMELIAVNPTSASCLETTDGSERHTCTGQVKFPDGDASFYGKAMLYGAIFSTSKAHYDCNFAQAAQQLQLVSQIYDEKQQILRRENQACTKYNLNFGYSATGSGWSSSADALFKANEGLGGRTCAFIF